jgi:hypothetical protein
MTGPVDVHTSAGAHVYVHDLDRLGAGMARVALRVDCRAYERDAVWVSLTPDEARMLAGALATAASSAAARTVQAPAAR